MHAISRGMLAGLFIALCSGSGQLAAQDKNTKDDFKDRLVGIGTSDNLTLNAYWFQGNGLNKRLPDAVLMYPAPGSKVNDAWLSLAKALSEKNFSVLLFDWRGCGMNSPEGAGARIFEDKTKFWREPYNGRMLAQTKGKLEDKGLDWKTLANAHDPRGRYRDFMLMNDLLAARFYLDKQNDDKKCNTSRVWVVSEKDGAHVGFAFMAAEFQRNSIFNPKENRLDKTGFRAAGKDYVGLIAMSYSNNGPSSSTATMVFRNALPTGSGNEGVREARNHLENRLATVLMHTKNEGPIASTSLIASLVRPGRASVVREGQDNTFRPCANGADLAEMKTKYKYIKEFDTTMAKAISGVDLIDRQDSFKAKEYVLDAMTGISKAQPFNKELTDRQAAKMVVVPRFRIEDFNRK